MIADPFELGPLHLVYARVFGENHIEFEVTGSAASWSFILAGGRAYDVGWVLGTAELSAPRDDLRIELSAELSGQLSVGSARA